MFANTQTAETCLGPALKAAYQVIQHVGGKLHVFTATRPTVGESPIKNREGAPAAAKPKEGTPTQLQPDGEFYKNLAVDCSKQQVCVDIWSFAGAYSTVNASRSPRTNAAAGCARTVPLAYDTPSGSDPPGPQRDLQ